MTTNPRSIAFDAENGRLICELCFEWVAFDELHTDTSGDKWDICAECGLNN